ncbi:MIP/aquaporin family protein [Sediminibacterium ginsengisoli]|uniref:Glycerol uptake facilitator protein n=1 Tax=Sediminibacterium ginsengisoli TaxID=413434 RepID=A0A1T4M3S6_9BACT|nr:MIP/aquaporin family protein [Sediminibacterium ginsengisoli]SJZ61374.1 glycerol uptake facilitator protein [Sediminibacterium ginsengisoli]
MSIFLNEFIATAILILLGNGVVANVVLNKTKGQNSGWIVITFGWAIAVFVAVYIAAKGDSGAHLNPAITIAFAAMKKISWDVVPYYVAGQLLGAMAGALVVWLSYMKHFDATPDGDAKQAVFCTAPAIRSNTANLLTEIIGTFVLVFGALYITGPTSSLGSLDALPVALLVLGIGLSLGGPTGYAINPARDLGPRIMHAILPLKQKGSNGWGYSWVPIAGPVIGALIAALVFGAVNG